MKFLLPLAILLGGFVLIALIVAINPWLERQLSPPVRTSTLSMGIPTSDRAEEAIAGVELALRNELSVQGLEYGAPIFLRLFKDPGTLELWVEAATGEFVLFKRYEICIFSGNPGPKLKEGDNQSPEGFYFVNSGRLNPWSRFHLSFNLGFPNEYDRYHGRTGSALMIHGDCVSVGCYAMTDPYINEIYALGVAALRAGQPFFRVHIFPFRLEPEILSQYQSYQWHPFWTNLQPGYEYFNKYKKPPAVTVSNGEYVFSAPVKANK